MDPFAGAQYLSIVGRFLGFGFFVGFLAFALALTVFLIFTVSPPGGRTLSPAFSLVDSVNVPAFRTLIGKAHDAAPNLFRLDEP